MRQIGHTYCCEKELGLLHGYTDRVRLVGPRPFVLDEQRREGEHPAGIVDNEKANAQAGRLRDRHVQFPQHLDCRELAIAEAGKLRVEINDDAGSAMADNDKTKNITPEDEVEELRQLLIQQLIDGLKAPSPKASFLAVVQKFLADSNGKPSAPPTMTGLAQGRDLPFPTAPATAAPSAPPRSVPFPAKGNQGQPWESLDKAPYAGPEFNAPKLT